MSVIDVRNPATGELAGHVERATPEDVAQAVGRARARQPQWAAQSFRQRARVIERFHDRMLDCAARVFDSIQSETGKARRDALAEVVTVAGTARYYIAHGRAHLATKAKRGAAPLFTAAEVV